VDLSSFDNMDTSSKGEKNIKKGAQVTLFTRK